MMTGVSSGSARRFGARSSVPLRRGAGLSACTHRHDHRILSIKFGDEFVATAPFRVVERPEATQHLHPAHPAPRRVLHQWRREETSRHKQRTSLESRAGDRSSLSGCCGLTTPTSGPNRAELWETEPVGTEGVCWAGTTSGCGPV